MTVATRDTASDPRQPRRFEKKTNTGLLVVAGICGRILAGVVVGVVLAEARAHVREDVEPRCE